jgi:DNA-binding NarL/FixJ family response regulator
MKTVFVVDSSRSDLHSIQEKLAGSYRLVAFEDAKSCSSAIKTLKNAHEEMPSLVLVDYALPEKGGLKLYKKLHGSLQDSQVMLMVDRRQSGHLLDIIKEGVLNYVLKDRELLTVITRALADKKPQAALLA